MLGDEAMAAAPALIDRVLRHCHLVKIRGNSYRMREHEALYGKLHKDADPAPPARRPRDS